MPSPSPQTSDFLLYQTLDGEVRINVFLHNETVWLTQKRMAELFGVEVQTINYHLKEIFQNSELDENSVIRKFRIPAPDGKDYLTNFYNLDAIISVGYRVNSRQATQFRIWATERLREYIIKGFTMDDARLKRAGGGQPANQREYTLLCWNPLKRRMRSSTIVSFLPMGKHPHGPRAARAPGNFCLCL